MYALIGFLIGVLFFRLMLRYLRAVGDKFGKGVAIAIGAGVVFCMAGLAFWVYCSTWTLVLVALALVTALKLSRVLDQASSGIELGRYQLPLYAFSIFGI
ncbi:MAG: hypothetical protein Q8J78_11330, partial [Moraxellaceae bacterium]|nr:hypothetical protein [Moraxellaceae bacterium]